MHKICVCPIIMLALQHNRRESIKQILGSGYMVVLTTVLLYGYMVVLTTVLLHAMIVNVNKVHVDKSGPVI